MSEKKLEIVYKKLLAIENVFRRMVESNSNLDKAFAMEISKAELRIHTLNRLKLDLETFNNRLLQDITALRDEIASMTPGVSKSELKAYVSVSAKYFRDMAPMIEGADTDSIRKNLIEHADKMLPVLSATLPKKEKKK